MSREDKWKWRKEDRKIQMYERVYSREGRICKNRKMSFSSNISANT